MAATKITIDGTDYELKAIPNKASHSSGIVDEKDWEIMAFGYSKKYNDGYSATVIIPKTKSGWFLCGLGEVPEQHCFDHKYDIHSVLRKSDGVVFSVGDKIQSKVDRPPFTIEKIQVINDNYIYLDSCPLENAQPIPQRTKLLTTGDGVDIYPDEKYYKVWDNFEISVYNSTWGTYHFEEFFKTTFSTEAAAKEYVILNKPALSVNDVIKSCSWEVGDLNYITRMEVERLKETVKSKL